MSEAEDNLTARNERILASMREYNALLKTVVEHNAKIHDNCAAWRDERLLCEECLDLLIEIERPDKVTIN